MSGSAVMDTSPASAPFSAMVRSALPNIRRARMSAASSPPAAAVLVFTKYLRDRVGLVDVLIFNSEPPLKPNHPNQRMNMPSVASGMLAPGDRVDLAVRTVLARARS